MSEQHVRDIQKQGWTDAIFLLPEKDRADYARLANTVITIALEDARVKESLASEVNPGLESGTVRTGMFGIGYPRNSQDQKVYLHTGYQSRQRADAIIPERRQSAVLQEFWEINAAMLSEIEASTVRVLGKIGAGSLRNSIFPPSFERRNVHLRTVRYTDAELEPVGKEVISGHADLGLMTLHLYETHGGWFYGAPYAPELITAEDTPARRAAIRTMREQMRLLEQSPDHASFFLGANWQTFPDVPEGLRDLPACYHAGFRPSSPEEVISPFASQVTLGANDRVSVISFMHPHGDKLKQGVYLPATVSNCRPEYQGKGYE